MHADLTCSKRPYIRSINETKWSKKIMSVRVQRIQRSQPRIGGGTDEETGQTPGCHGNRGPLGEV